MSAVRNPAPCCRSIWCCATPAHRLPEGSHGPRGGFHQPGIFRNPAAQIERLRAAGPVVEVRFPLVGKVWTTTTQDLANQVLRDSKTFTLRKDDGNVAGLRWWMPGVVRTIADNMLTTDEPDHTRLRSIVDEVFPRRAVLEMQSRIMVLANELADTLFADGSPPTFRSLCAKTAAFRDLRPSQAAARRPAQVRCLGKHLHALQQRPRLSRRHTDALHHEHYMQERLDAAHKDGGAGVIAELVRIEGKCALQALFERWPKLSLATDDSNLRWRTRTGIRALGQLPVAAGN